VWLCGGLLNLAEKFPFSRYTPSRAKKSLIFALRATAKIGHSHFLLWLRDTRDELLAIFEELSNVTAIILSYYT
jgi:hypothetical protein